MINMEEIAKILRRAADIHRNSCALQKDADYNSILYKSCKQAGDEANLNKCGVQLIYLLLKHIWYDVLYWTDYALTTEMKGIKNEEKENS